MERGKNTVRHRGGNRRLRPAQLRAGEVASAASGRGRIHGDGRMGSDGHVKIFAYRQTGPIRGDFGRVPSSFVLVCQSWQSNQHATGWAGRMICLIWGDVLQCTHP